MNRYHFTTSDKKHKISVESKYYNEAEFRMKIEKGKKGIKEDMICLDWDRDIEEKVETNQLELDIF